MEINSGQSYNYTELNEIKTSIHPRPSETYQDV